MPSPRRRAKPRISKMYRPAQLKGGKASNYFPWQFDQQQLWKGIQVEMEHTRDIYIAMLIAMDHLVEIPIYYDLLEDMERGYVK
jgi:hypothetical protein